jgi:SAM-dependent methyltransferase
LYAVSNAGSFAGLLAYPLVIEPRFAEPLQRMGWSLGYGLYLALAAACGILYLKASQRMQQEKAAPEDFQGAAPALPSASLRISWMLLALLPVAALMAFTHHVTEEILNLPLLWVVPLCLHLLSFVICFLFPFINRPSPARTLLLLGAIFLFLITGHRDIPVPSTISLAAACLCLFAICLYFHGNLERAKPPKEQLTGFYLYLSLGGCLGGLLGGIAAPLLLRSNFELPLVLIVAVWAGMTSLPFAQSRRIKVFAAAGAAILMAVTFAQSEFGWLSQAEHRARSFYGAYEITAMPAVEGRWVEARLLTMGNTIHGGEVITPDGRYLPMAYYHPDTAAGMALMRFADARNIGVVGLGTGNLALYGRPGQNIDFFEIDPLVIRLATERFGVLAASRANIRHIVGDARLKLAQEPDSRYDLLFLDAFSSGSIPIHLLTLEAVEAYLQKLAPDGIMLFHISNRFADLTPVLACNARKLGLFISEHNSAANPVLHQFPSRWVALSKSRQAMHKLTASAPGWSAPAGEPICWTDSFSCLLNVVRLSGRKL